MLQTLLWLEVVEHVCRIALLSFEAPYSTIYQAPQVKPTPGMGRRCVIDAAGERMLTGMRLSHRPRFRIGRQS